MRKKPLWVLLCLVLMLSVFASCGKTYQVTFYPNNGQAETKVQVNKGESAQAPANPVKEGFRFEYWCSDEALQTEYDFSLPVKKNISLYAKYVQVEYATITFDANGGQMEESLKRRTVETGVEIGALPTPVRQGYAFKGWYANAQGEGEVYTSASIVTASITLYAVWGQNATAVNTPQDLQNMTADGNYFLTATIDMADVVYNTKFDLDTPFRGVLDGNGFTIENLTVTGAQSFAGLFGCVSGEIRNLKLRAVEISADTSETVYAGGIAGYLLGGKIDGCSVAGSVRGNVTNKYKAPYVGGIAGRNDAGTISECGFSGTVESVSSQGAAYAGGISGYNGIGLKEKGNISDCLVTGASVYADSRSGNTGAAYAGGIAGFNYGAVANCIALTEKVYAKAWDYHAYAGGITADNNGGTAQGCLSAVKLVEAKTAAGDSSTGFITGRNFLNGNQYDSYAYGGVKIIASPYDDSYLPYTRHYREVSEFAPAASLSSKEWYGELGYSDAWKFEAGKFPSLHGVSISVPETAEAGTYANPIAVTSAEELLQIDCNLSYVLQNDIDVTGLPFAPIGTYAKPYYGVFDGNGNTIRYSLSQSAQGFAGVFGYLNGTVKNLYVHANVDITEDASYPLYCGGVAGWNKGGTIENCHARGVMALRANGGYGGGIVGFNESGRIARSSSETEITLTVNNPTAYLGGVAGATSGNVSESFSDGNLTLVCNSVGYLGGIAGKADGCALTDSYANGELRLQAKDGGNAFAAGIVGYMQRGEIKSVYSAAAVSSAGVKAGIAAHASECAVYNTHWLKSEGMDKGIGNSALDTGAVSYRDVAAMYGLADALNDGRDGVWIGVADRLPDLGWQ